MAKKGRQTPLTDRGDITVMTVKVPRPLISEFKEYSARQYRTVGMQICLLMEQALVEEKANANQN